MAQKTITPGKSLFPLLNFGLSSGQTAHVCALAFRCHKLGPTSLWDQPCLGWSWYLDTSKGQAYSNIPCPTEAPRFNSSTAAQNSSCLSVSAEGQGQWLEYLGSSPMYNIWIKLLASSPSEGTQ